MTVQDTINALESLGCQLHLTGSRYFGTATEKSDYDYFAPDTPVERRILNDAGFILDAREHAPFALTTAVYCHPSLPIHVQLVRDVQQKIKTQEALKQSGLYSVLRNKQLARSIWLFAILLLNE